MTDRRHLIRYVSCCAVALGFAVALPTTKSEAQPLGPSLSQMQSQTQPVFEKAQMRRGGRRGPRRGRRGARGGWGPRISFGFGPQKHCWWGPHGRHCKWW
jgi:hypothetical protein